MTTTDPDVEYAFWTSPGSTFTVTYPLALFHEIDFQVNEGYRRIPHGGIESGGLLFGRSEGDSIRIEAFRNIECEHASGPSFVLSERDLAQLKAQITGTSGDTELHGLAVLGWFIGHTRSSLKMNDRECAVFDELFPGPGKITLLIKPERFQPTRFGFLVRNSDGKFETDATERAIILPLPGRATRSAEGPIPSIPAPVDVRPESPPVPKRDPKPVGSPVTKTETRPYRQPGPASAPAAQPEAADPGLTGSKQAEELQTAKAVLGLAPASQTPSTDIRGPYRETIPQEADLRTSHRKTRKLDSDRTRPNLRLLLVLLLAAALGCAVGYWAYSQLPPATIALNVHAEPSNLLISWPAEQTRDAVYAAIRIDDGQPVPLSAEEKATGEAEVTPTSDNVKIELIARHWIRDSRGILRYLKPLSAVNAQATANTQAPGPAQTSSRPPVSSEPR